MKYYSESSSLESDARACFAMEAALSEPLFMGTPIGSTLNDFLASEFIDKSRFWKTNTPGIDWARGFYHYSRPRCAPESMPDLHSGRYLLTWLGEREHLRKLVLPLVSAFGPGRCNVVGSKPAMRGQLPAGTGFATFDQVYANPGSWRRAFNGVWYNWAQKIRAGTRSHERLRGTITRLGSFVIVQSRRVAAARRFLQAVKPAAVITEADRNELASCLVLAARATGIPTFTLIHGAINPPYGYTPVLADRIFCWGELHVRQLSSLGVDHDRMVVTGCQALTRFLTASPRQARVKAGLPVDQPVVLLVSSPIRPDQRLSFSEQFCRAFENQEGVSAAVRLYHSEQLEFYEALRTRFTRVLFMTNDKWSLDEALSTADVIVCHDSGFGNEALIKRKPVVVFDVLTEPLRNGKTLIDEAKCPRATSSEELAAVVSRIIRDAAFRTRLIDDADRFVGDFCAAFDDKAVSNITAAVRHFVENPGR